MTHLTIDGGSGNDTIIGSQGADTLLGGSGNDVVTGGRGNDVEFLGSGDDVSVWNPGDGSDTVDGGSGFDTLDFRGANAAENVSISANGSHATLLSATSLISRWTSIASSAFSSRPLAAPTTSSSTTSPAPV